MAFVVDVDCAHRQQLRLLFPARLAALVPDAVARAGDHDDDVAGDARLRGASGGGADVRLGIRLVDARRPFRGGGAPTELAVLLCVAGVATGALSLNTYAVAQMFAGPRAAGTWVGIQNAFGNMSGIFGPIVTGIIVDRAGYTSAFLVTAVVAAFGAVWWLAGVPRIEQVELD
jgi:MFS family permease